jgi:hypothetical protein
MTDLKPGEEKILRELWEKSASTSGVDPPQRPFTVPPTEPPLPLGTPEVGTARRRV